MGRRNESKGRSKESVLPPYVEKYYGRDFVDFIDTTSSAVREYEEFSLDKDIPIVEVVEYMRDIGFFEEYGATIKDLVDKTGINDPDYITRLQSTMPHYNENAIRRRLSSVYHEIFKAVEGRPILSSVVGEFFHLVSVNAQEAVLKKHNSLQDGIRPMYRALIGTGLQRGLRFLMSFPILYCDHLAHHLKELEESYREIVSKRDDDEECDMRNQDIGNGTFVFSPTFPIPGVNRIVVERSEKRHEFLWGRVFLYWEDTSTRAITANREMVTQFNITYFNNDLCASDAMITSVRDDLSLSGITREDYDKFVFLLQKNIQIAIESGVIPLRETKSSAQESATSDHSQDLEAKPSDARDVSDERENPVLDVSTEEPVHRDPSTIPDETSLAPTKMRRKGSVERITAINQTKVLGALRSMGIDVITDRHGKHPILARLREDGTRLSVPFYNTHSDQKSLPPSSIRKILKWLEIDTAKFLEHV